jgi:hypothetical protein
MLRSPRLLASRQPRIRGSEGASPGQAGLNILILLLLLVSCQDLVRILVLVAGRAGISDSDVKDSRRAPPPEPVDRDVVRSSGGSSAPSALFLTLPSQPLWIKGSSETAEGVSAWAQI